MPTQSNNPFKTPRSYDKESGMNRTQKKFSPKYKDAELEIENGEYSDSEVDEFVERADRDDTLRPKTVVTRGTHYRGEPVQKKAHNVEATQKDIDVVQAKEPTFGATGAVLLLAMARHVEPVPRSFLGQNQYVPDCANMFETVAAMTKVISDNLKLYELIPDYSSIAITLYYSHVYFYQILRARDTVGTLDRFERRSLRIYETVGKPESWPIALPLSGFIQALGSCQLDNKMFSIVTPSFPDFAKFTSSKGLEGLSNVDGIGRVPIVPAYHKFLRNFAHRTAFYNDTDLKYYPTTTPLSDTNRFIGLASSTAASRDFQSLAFNSSWNEATETEEPVGYMSRGGVQIRTARWNIPDIGDTHDFSQGMEHFLFPDQRNIKWMSNLLRLSEAVNRFFPGSSNLGAIPPSTVAETFTDVHYYTSKEFTRTPAKDKWYQDRNNWSLDAKAKTFSDSTIPLIKMAVSTSTRSRYDAHIIPENISNVFDPKSNGPYFIDPTNETTVPLTESEVIKALDPTTGIQELTFSLYQNNPN